MPDFRHLVQAVDSQSPCGPDCEYDGDFLALSQAVAGKSEQQYGNTVIPAVEPDWRVVEQMATDLLVRTKDLRVATWLTQAATYLHGTQGFAAGLELVQQLCALYWDEVHPQMIIDGDDDPYLRINALAALSDGVGTYSIIKALRAALLANRALPLTVRDIEMGVQNDATTRYSDIQILSILKDALAEGTETITAFEQGAQAFLALVAQVEERMANGEQPDFSALKALAKAVTTTLVRAKTDGQPAPSADGSLAPIAGDAGGDTGGAPFRSIPGEVRSREDARRALQRVCDYLERHEPSNPAALFARRAERMLDLGFLDIMRELAPDTMSHLHMLTGTKQPDQSY